MLKRIINKLKFQEICMDAYILDTGKAEAGQLSNKINITIFDSKNGKTGYPEIDKKASSRKMAFFIKGDENEIAHVTWLYKKNLLAYQIGLKNHFVIGDCFTNPKYRGKGYYGHTVLHVIRYVYPIKTVLFISSDNHSSIKGVQKIGCNKKFSFCVVRFLGLALKVRKYEL